jgi:ubiquinone/menaquinone biosynthesis C-methylase UbiE
MPIFVSFLDLIFYPDFQNNWDNTFFRKILLEKKSLCNTVLDLGAGAGIVESMNFKGHFSKIYGIDLDNRVLNNPFLDDAKIGNVECLPYKESSFDLVFSANVLEHLNKPEIVFKEVYRVLKPGGYFITKTPNKYHYVPMIAKLTPDFFHKKINKIRGRKELDTFPTLYRVNSIKDQRRIAVDCGFVVENIITFEGRPEYLRMHFIPYLFGILYGKTVNLHPIFANFRVIIISHFRKPETV